MQYIPSTWPVQAHYLVVSASGLDSSISGLSLDGYFYVVELICYDMTQIKAKTIQFSGPYPDAVQFIWPFQLV